MALNDVFQIKVNQNLNGEDLMNVFYYRQITVGSGNAEDLADVFINDTLDAITNLQAPQLAVVSVEVINGMSNFDYHIEPTSLVGEYGAGQTLPPHIGVAFRSISRGPGTRYSYKRFAGARTAFLGGNNNGQFDTAFLEGYGNPVGVALGSNLEGAAAGYQPVQITGGFKLGEAPVVAHDLMGQWAIDAYFSHQDTRQDYLWLTPDPV